MKVVRVALAVWGMVGLCLAGCDSKGTRNDGGSADIEGGPADSGPADDDDAASLTLIEAEDFTVYSVVPTTGVSILEGKILSSPNAARADAGWSTDGGATWDANDSWTRSTVWAASTVYIVRFEFIAQKGYTFDAREGAYEAGGRRDLSDRLTGVESFSAVVSGDEAARNELTLVITFPETAPEA